MQEPQVRKIPWKREWLPSPVFLLGEPHGQRSLGGYSPWSHKELDMTEWLTISLLLSVYLRSIKSRVQFFQESCRDVNIGPYRRLSTKELMLLNCSAGESLKKLMRTPQAARISSQSILKEIHVAYSLEGLMLKLMLHYFDHLMWRANDPGVQEDWGKEEKGVTED